MTNLVAIAIEFVPQDLRVRMALSAATDATGFYHFNGSLYRLPVQRRAGRALPLSIAPIKYQTYPYIPRTETSPELTTPSVPSG